MFYGIANKEQKGGTLVSGELWSHYIEGRSRGRTPRTPIKILHITNQWGGHVVPMDWATCPHIICHQLDTCQHPTRQQSTNQHLPHQCTDCTDRYSQHLKIFACLPWRTDHDIFSIRTPFEKVNISSESGRRDRRNGTNFIAFQALWNLSKFLTPSPDSDHLFHPLQRSLAVVEVNS